MISLDAPAGVRDAVLATLSAVGVSEGHLAVAFVDEDEIRRLNVRFRGVDAPTDVLSFPVDERGGEAAELGDVFICVEHSADVTEAVVHGVLHLCGYDHEVDGGEMLQVQRRVLAALR